MQRTSEPAPMDSAASEAMTTPAAQQQAQDGKSDEENLLIATESKPAPKTRRQSTPKWEIIETKSHVLKINRNPRIQVAVYCRHDFEECGFLEPSMYFCDMRMPTYVDVLLYERGDDVYPVWSAHLTLTTYSEMRKKNKEYGWIEIDYLGSEADEVAWGMIEGSHLEENTDSFYHDRDAMTGAMLRRAALVAEQFDEGTYVPVGHWGLVQDCNPGQYGTARKAQRPKQPIADAEI